MTNQHVHHVILPLLLLAYAIKTHNWSTSIISRVKLRQTTIPLGKRAGFNNVRHLTTGAQTKKMLSV